MSLFDLETKGARKQAASLPDGPFLPVGVRLKRARYRVISKRGFFVRTSQPALVFILVTLFLDVLGFGLLIPVAPKLIESLVVPGQAVSVGLTHSMIDDREVAASAPAKLDAERIAAPYVGYLTATYAVMQFLFAPILGALSDKYGRRTVLLISIFGSGLDYFAMALSPTILILFVTRALNGLSGASMTVASAYIADTTTPEKRAAGFGMMGAAFGIGFILGPLLGGVLGAYNIRAPFYAAGILSLVNWLYGVFVLPESLPLSLRGEFSLARANPFAALPGLGRRPLIGGLAASLFLFNLAMFGLHATWVLYTSHRYGWSSFDVGLSLFLVGIGAAIVQAGLAARVIRKIGERKAIMLGAAIGVLAYIGYGAATQGWMIYAVVIAASLGGIAQPAIQAVITRHLAPTEQGAVQGAITGLQSIANIFGPLIGSQVFAYFISKSAPMYVPGASFFVGAVLAAIGWIVAAIATRHVSPLATAQAASDGGHEPARH